MEPMINQVLSAISDGLTIIASICILIKLIVNYKLGIKFEKKFGIPKEYYKFSFKEMLIETSEYILMFFTIFLIMYMSINGFLSPIKEEPFASIINCLLLYLVFFFYTIASIDVLREKFNLRYKNNNLCCFFVKYVFIQIFLSYLCLKFDIFLIVIISIMITFAIYCIMRYINFYTKFDNNKYEIIKIEEKNYAIFYFNKNFILIELVKDGDNYIVKDKGNYIIKDIINKEKTIKSIIVD